MRTIRITRQVATDFYSMYEHLGNVGQGVWHYALLATCGRMVAVESFGHLGFRPSQSAVLQRIEERFQAVGFYQLCRGASVPGVQRCLSSVAVSRALRLFREDVGPCVILAYADEGFREIGTVYQACNAFYLGQTDPKGQSNYRIRGVIYNAWSVRRYYGTRDMAKLRKMEPAVKKILLRRKHRYVFVAAPPALKRRLSSELAPHCLPYPKRTTRGVPNMNVHELIQQRA